MKVQITLTEKEKVDRLIKYLIDTDDSAEDFKEYKDIKEIIKDPIIHSYNVGYISPEMSEESVGYRFDSLNKHFSNFALYTGKDVENYEEYIDDLKTNAKNKFIVATPLDFNRKITVSKLRKFCLQHKLDVLCIDGITYLSDERYHKGDNKTTSLTNISEDLMSLSCELKIPIIAIDASINLYNADKFLEHASNARDNARKMLYGIAAMIETRFDD